MFTLLQYAMVPSNSWGVFAAGALASLFSAYIVGIGLLLSVPFYGALASTPNLSPYRLAAAFSLASSTAERQCCGCPRWGPSTSWGQWGYHPLRTSALVQRRTRLECLEVRFAATCPEDVTVEDTSLRVQDQDPGVGQRKTCSSDAAGCRSRACSLEVPRVLWCILQRAPCLKMTLLLRYCNATAQSDLMACRASNKLRDDQHRIQTVESGQLMLGFGIYHCSLLECMAVELNYQAHWHEGGVNCGGSCSFPSPSPSSHGLLIAMATVVLCTAVPMAVAYSA